MRAGRRLVVSAILLLPLAAAACGDDGPAGDGSSDATSTTASVRTIDRSISDAVAFLRARVARSDDPLVVSDAAVNLDYLARRFGGGADLAWVDDELTPRAIAFAATAGSDPVSQQIHVFVRMVDPSATLATPPASLGITGGSAVTAAALWCDRYPLPPDHSATVGAAIEAGGYELTHAAAGLVLAQERGCPAPPGVDGALDRAVGALPGLLSPPADLSLEACGILGYLGRPDLIPSSYVDEVRAAQGADGGWGQEPGGESTVHATEWGLRCLLEARDGAATPREPWAVGGSVLPGGP